MPDELLNQLPNDWADAINSITPNSQPLSKCLVNVAHRYHTESVLPAKDQVFNALKLTPWANVKVVILGQDPYPTKAHAMGLSFSIPESAKMSRSLKNIFKEREADLGIPINDSGDLTRWAEQGVLLLNTILTVKEGKPESHKSLGWQAFTTPMIQSLNQRDDTVVFLLWGNKAQHYAKYIDDTRHVIIKTSHPSPLGANTTNQPFTGSRCFSRANDALVSAGETPIDWNN